MAHHQKVASKASTSIPQASIVVGDASLSGSILPPQPLPSEKDKIREFLLKVQSTTQSTMSHLDECKQVTDALKADYESAARLNEDSMSKLRESDYLVQSALLAFGHEASSVHPLPSNDSDVKASSEGMTEACGDGEIGGRGSSVTVNHDDDVISNDRRRLLARNERYAQLIVENIRRNLERITKLGHASTRQKKNLASDVTNDVIDDVTCSEHGDSSVEVIVDELLRKVRARKVELQKFQSSTNLSRSRVGDSEPYTVTSIPSGYKEPRALQENKSQMKSKDDVPALTKLDQLATDLNEYIELEIRATHQLAKMKKPNSRTLNRRRKRYHRDPGYDEKVDEGIERVGKMLRRGDTHGAAALLDRLLETTEVSRRECLAATEDVQKLLEPRLRKLKSGDSGAPSGSRISREMVEHYRKRMKKSSTTTQNNSYGRIGFSQTDAFSSKKACPTIPEKASNKRQDKIEAQALEVASRPNDFSQRMRSFRDEIREYVGLELEHARRLRTQLQKTKLEQERELRSREATIKELERKARELGGEKEKLERLLEREKAAKSSMIMRRAVIPKQRFQSIKSSLLQPYISTVPPLGSNKLIVLPPLVVKTAEGTGDPSQSASLSTHKPMLTARARQLVGGSFEPSKKLSAWVKPTPRLDLGISASREVQHDEASNRSVAGEECGVPVERKSLFMTEVGSN